MLNQVFISYRRENDEHTARVRRLAEGLKGVGLTVVFDEFYLAENPAGPPEKWSRWCINHAKNSACVLMVGSAGWYSAFTDPSSVAPGIGCGAAAEAHVIQEQLHQAHWTTDRHRMVLVDSSDAAGLPVELIGWQRFSPLDNAQEMKDLCRWAGGLTGVQLSNPGGPDLTDWPDTFPVQNWPMADHHAVRTAFAMLLTRSASSRFLPIRGGSETGKSHITKQILAHALASDYLRCGRFDFKGTTNIDSEIDAFVQHLGVAAPPTLPSLHARLSRILEALKKDVRPTLLIFDTYEVAGEAEEWIEKQLLTGLVRAPWLRVVVAGQKVPASSGVVWSAIAHAPLQLVSPPAKDWFEYGRPHRPDLTLEFVEKACVYAAHKPGLLAQLLGPAT